MLNMSFFVLSWFSDQVLSITPKTQKQVDILKNVSSQYEVEFFFPSFLWLLCSNSMSPSDWISCVVWSDILVAACLTPVHPGGDAGPSIRACKQPRDCHGSAEHTYHNSWVHCQKSVVYLKKKNHKNVYLQNIFCFRVLLANAKELIEMQTRNDTTDPRSTVTFYEKYHSLNDVRSLFFLSFCLFVVMKIE